MKRNFQKWISLFLIFAMLFSMNGGAFAVTETVKQSLTENTNDDRNTAVNDVSKTVGEDANKEVSSDNQVGEESNAVEITNYSSNQNTVVNGIEAEFYIRNDEVIQSETGDNQYSEDSYSPAAPGMSGKIKEKKDVFQSLEAVRENILEYPSEADIKAAVGDENYNEEDYKVLWYVIKDSPENSDTWHVDGIIVKKDALQLTYHKNFNTGTESEYYQVQSYTKYDEVTVNYTPIRLGYEFKGWNTKADGTGDLYDNGNKFSIVTNTILYAQWEPQKGPVIFKTGAFGKFEGSNEKEIIQYYTIGEMPDKIPTVVADEGYEFLGWDSSLESVTEAGATYTATYKKNNVIFTANSDTDIIYDGKIHSIPIDGYTSSINNVTFKDVKIDVVNRVQVGTYKVTFTEKPEKVIGSDGKIYFASYVDGALIIKKLSLNLKAENTVKKYNGKSQGLTPATAIEGAIIEYSVDNGTTWKTEVPKLKNVSGVQVKVRARKEGYEEATKIIFFGINRAPITVKAKDVEKEYGTADPKFTADVKGLVNGESEDLIHYTVSRATNDNDLVGSHELVVTGEKKQGNYVVTFEKGTLNIKKAAKSKLQLVVVDAEQVFNGEALTKVATAIDGAKIEYKYLNQDWTEVAPSLTVVGNMTVEVRANKEGYEEATDSYQLTVTPRKVTITANDFTKVYGEKDPNFIATVENEIPGYPVNYTLGRDVKENVGTYEIKNYEMVGIVGNYDITYVPAKLVIKKKPVTITSASSSKFYDGTPLTNPNVRVTSDLGFLVRDEITYKATGLIIDVGSTKNTIVVEGEGLSNYAITKQEGTLTVNSNEDNDDTITIDSEETPLGRLNYDDHFAYVEGYPDKSVRPNGNITRAEVSAIFFRLLEAKYKEEVRSNINSFNDVMSKSWYNKHVSTLFKGKIINGYQDGTFRPNQQITRAELAVIASRFDQLELDAVNPFSDVKGHWAEKYIASAAKKGWVSGYRNGTFRPDQPITRAEFMTLVNNVLNRHVTTKNILPGTIQFTDLQNKDVWFYNAVKIATNSYLYENVKDEPGYQKWTKLIKPVIEM